MSNLKRILKRKCGFSLLEMLMTLAIFTILLIIITNLIVVNLIVARRIEARTKVREETSYVLKNIKKDIRNAGDVDISGNKVIVEMATPDGGTTLKCWVFNAASERLIRRNGCDASCSASSCTEGVDYRTPGDVSITSFNAEIHDYGSNKLLVIRIEARADGMPEGQTVDKIVGIATRNYN